MFKRRMQRAAQDTGGFSWRYDVAPGVVVFVTAWVVQHSEAGFQLRDLAIPSIAGIAALFVAHLIHFGWNFARANDRIALADERKAHDLTKEQLSAVVRERDRLREVAAAQEAMLNQRSMRMNVKRLLGKRRATINNLGSDAKDEEILRELQLTLDLVEAAFGEGEAILFAQGSHHPQFRVMGTRDVVFRAMGAVLDIDDLVSRTDAMTLVDGFNVQEWERRITTAPTPDKAATPPPGAS